MYGPVIQLPSPYRLWYSGGETVPDVRIVNDRPQGRIRFIHGCTGNINFASLGRFILDLYFISAFLVGHDHRKRDLLYHFDLRSVTCPKDLQTEATPPCPGFDGLKWPSYPPSDMTNIFLFSPVGLADVLYYVYVSISICLNSSVVSVMSLV